MHSGHSCASSSELGLRTDIFDWAGVSRTISRVSGGIAEGDSGVAEELRWTDGRRTVEWSLHCHFFAYYSLFLSFFFLRAPAARQSCQIRKTIIFQVCFYL